MQTENGGYKQQNLKKLKSEKEKKRKRNYEKEKKQRESDSNYLRKARSEERIKKATEKENTATSAKKTSINKMQDHLTMPPPQRFPETGDKYSGAELAGEPSSAHRSP
ncbi:hypothetical protein HAX54_019432 [Datura stramonium]|uniref:Uncharacterized protein n=1 Tax=Datura stramonium TaxID=4076 RepID=A0ABS8UR76_DATST|nr:hypothetical protein [Datura stramonium]